MKKNTLPKNIKELGEIFYDENKKEERKRYLDSLKTKVLSPDLEKEVSRIFKDLNFKKIEKSGLKTFDFKDINQKILAEITSIDFGIDSEINEIKSKPKISKAIRHLGEKDSNNFPDFARGGIMSEGMLMD